jgi:membrane peptidoglycan carboxypeptidase
MTTRATNEGRVVLTYEVVLQRKRRGGLGLVRLPVALLLLGAAGVVGWLGMSTPSAADLPQRVDALSYGRPLTPADVPAVLAGAVVAVEDERFYQHHGLDTVGTARAAWTDLSGRCLCEGGSTITQQLAKNVYFVGDDRVSRKLPGMAVALKIELRTSKAAILADYLSVVPTGYNLVGARQAACAYFGHGLEDLTAAQAAEIAGTLAAPSVYDPRLNPDLAAARRDHTLDRMVETGRLSAQAAAAARTAPVLTGGVPHSPNCA